jgi:HSP20 family molecular chaperone IbpA
MPNPLDKLFGRDNNKDEDGSDGLNDLLADARRRRGVPPDGRGFLGRNSSSSNNGIDDIDAFFANHPFFGGRAAAAGGLNSPASIFENSMTGATHSSSYQIHQDGKEVTIDVDLPGVSAKELKVEVLQNIQSCVVQWSGERKQRHQQPQQQLSRNGMASSSSSLSSSFNNRLRLGPQIDCDKFTANLSHGMLTMKAPVKDMEETSTVRSVQVTEN